MVKIFKNIKEAQSIFNFPGSYRTGTLTKNNFVIRIYSNSVSANDYFKNNKRNFYYIIKSPKIYNCFKNNKNFNKNIHLFKKNLEKNNLEYYGMYKVKGFREKNKYVLLEKI